MRKTGKSRFREIQPLRFLGGLSLGKKIMLLTALGLLVGASALVYPGLRATQEATDMMLEDRLTTARLVADSLDESLRLSLDILKATASHVTMAQTPAELEQQTGALWATYSQLSIYTDSMYLFDGGGKLVWSKPPASTSTSETTSTFVETVSGQGSGPTVSGLVASPVSNNPVVLLTCATGGDSPAQSGRLALAIDLARSGFMGFVRPMRLGNTGYVEVVDQSGVVVVRTEPGPKIAPFEESDHSGRFSELIVTGKPTRGLCHTCHATSQKVATRDVLAFVPLSTARWGVVIRQSEQEAMAPIRRLQRGLLLSGGGLVIVAFILAAVTTRNIVKRVQTLTGASERIAGGDLDSPVTTTGNDEIGTLAEALESMRSRLKTSYTEIEQRTRELSSLLAISEVLASLPGLSDLTAALGHALDRTLEIMKMDSGALLLPNEEKNTLSYLVYRGLPPEYAESATYPLADLAGENAGENVTVSDLEEGTTNPLHDQLRALGIHTLVSMPLRSKQGILGILLLAHHQARQFSSQDTRLLEGIGRYMATALENARLHQEVQAKEAIRGELLQDMLTVQEEERRRIARELHDETSQVLASLNANLEAAVNTLHSGDGKTELLLKKVQSMSVSIMDNINKLIYQLRPSLLDDLGLVAAIRWLEANNLRPAGVRARLVTRGRQRRLPRESETAIFRVVQEAFSNVVRHARAKHVGVTLLFAEELVTLDIEDDGTGFDVEEAIHSRARPRGLGLLGMTERIEIIGGKITIHSQEAAGTQIHIEIPRRKETQDG
jgi:signal transduction histidine kinase/HAMP domain-containing protein